MSQQTATVPISLVCDLLTGVADKTTVVEQAIEQSGIARELLGMAAARVTVDQFAELYRRLALLLDDETPGFFSRPLRGGTLKFLCLSMLDAANLNIALHRFVSYFRLLLDDLAFEVSREEGMTRIALIEIQAPRSPRTLVHELLLKLVHGVASWMIGRKIPLLQVDFAFARPARASEYIYLYPGPARFEQAQTALYISPEYLQATIRQDKYALSRFLHRAPADWIYVSFSERLLAHRVRDYLEPRLAAAPTLAAVADALHLSVRTLSRRLLDEGTTFKAVKDELRRDMAILSLTKSEQAIAAVGAAIGFEDHATFSRAFKQWTGSSPGAYRRRGF